MVSTKQVFDDCIAEIPEETKQEIALSFAISNKIYEILKEQHLSQKDFAKMTGKTQAEVSRWLSGTHNFTLRTLCLISTTLHQNIVNVE